MNKARYLLKLKRKAFKLWSESIRKIGYCELCGLKLGEKSHTGKPIILDAHHIVERINHRLAWDTLNGVSLCKYCHKFSKIGPHKGGIIFSEWFRVKYPEKYQYLLSVHQEPFEVNIQNMEKIVENLSNEKKNTEKT